MPAPPTLTPQTDAACVLLRHDGSLCKKLSPALTAGCSVEMKVRSLTCLPASCTYQAPTASVRCQPCNTAARGSGQKCCRLSAGVKQLSGSFVSRVQGYADIRPSAGKLQRQQT